MTADVAKAAALLFVAAVIQVSLLSAIDVAGAVPDLLLVTLLCVALLRGSLFGATAGFAAGLLVDTAHLQTLGVTSLLYTVGAYWIGRYGETTGRDRGHAPYLSTGSAHCSCTTSWARAARPAPCSSTDCCRACSSTSS